MSKVDAYCKSPKGKKRIEEYLSKCAKEGKRETAAGSRIRTDAEMVEMATRMIEILRKTAIACDLPDSVIQHFNTLEASEPKKLADGTTSICIYFNDDLHRDSLEPGNYSGIDNVVALLNNGYGEHPNMAHVWGEWHGNYIHGLTQRTGLQFIQQAVRDFNDNYGPRYNVTAVAGSDYN